MSTGLHQISTSCIALTNLYSTHVSHYITKLPKLVNRKTSVPAVQKFKEPARYLKVIIKYLKNVMRYNTFCYSILFLLRDVT